MCAKILVLSVLSVVLSKILVLSVKCALKSFYLQRGRIKNRWSQAQNASQRDAFWACRSAIFAIEFTLITHFVPHVQYVCPSIERFGSVHPRQSTLDAACGRPIDHARRGICLLLLGISSKISVFLYHLDMSISLYALATGLMQLKIRNR